MPALPTLLGSSLRRGLGCYSHASSQHSFWRAESLHESHAHSRIVWALLFEFWFKNKDERR
ncbi:Acyltransferase fer5 [Clarias magur]|uniref:Acyltransferase fer5 n=1 Tax=Clarias magur TaxID=1594786 RepID=A0A8J4U2J9_CLAMG|nr:Acyltransferase fer5 [Clarias magur]